MYIPEALSFLYIVLHYRRLTSDLSLALALFGLREHIGSAEHNTESWRPQA